MGQVRPKRLQLALLLVLLLLIRLNTTGYVTLQSCLLRRKCAPDSAGDGHQRSPRELKVINGNSISVISDGRLSAGWFADLQDLRGRARRPAELGGWAESKSAGNGSTEFQSAFRLSESARLWLKSSVAFSTPRAIRAETVGTSQAGSLELTLLTLDGGHEHSTQMSVSSGDGKSGTAVFVATLSGAQFLLWQSIEVASIGTGPLFLRRVQIDYPSPSELLQEQVDRIKAASPALLLNRTARTGGPSVLVSLLSLAKKSHLQRRLVPLISVLAPEVDLLVFVGNNTGEAYAAALAQKYGGLPLKWRNVSDAYPPRLKEFDSWQYVYENHVDDYEWFLHMDDDT